MAELTYDLFKTNHTSQYPQISFFSLQDGESAYVRFHLKSANDLQVYQVHKVNIDGKYRIVRCSGDNCPLCKCGDKPQSKLYLELVVYDTDIIRNVVTTRACVWERSAYDYRNRLIALEGEYGNLDDYIFKITRNGQVGDPNTTYDIFPANPKYYTDDLYKKDFSAFDNYSVESLFKTTIDSEEQAKQVLQRR